MKKIFGFVMCILFFVAIFAIYKLKYEVRNIKSEVATLEEKLKEEHKTLHVLEAEWSYLTRPDRIRSLANQYLKLRPVTADQLIHPASLASLQDMEYTDEDAIIAISADPANSDITTATDDDMYNVANSYDSYDASYINISAQQE